MKIWMNRVILLVLVCSILLGNCTVLYAAEEDAEDTPSAAEIVEANRLSAEANQELAELMNQDRIQPTRPDIERQEQRQNMQRAWDEATESYIDYQLNDTDSTFYKIAGDVADKSFEDIAKEEAVKIFCDEAGPVVEFLNACRKFLDNGAKLLQYQSEHEHGIFKWTDIACETYSFICDTVVDFADVLNMKILTLPIQTMNYLVSFTQDFFNLPEVVEVLNNSNPWFMKILDFIFDVIEDPEGTKDRLLDPVNWFKWWIRMVEWINCYKPNIYIYGEAGTELTVTFEQPQLLTTTIPEYDAIWNVVLEEDGQLTVDGVNDFDFLFYESVTLPELLQDEAGFVIDADTREEQFREIMTAYGFNEAETDDFVEFWVEKLEAGEDYVMYPQLTEAVDIAMPITVETEEEIDSYYRIWFYFVETDQAELAAVAEPEIVPVEHEGLTLIEWGGVVE